MKSRAFSIVELIVSTAILIVLSAILPPVFAGAKGAGADSGMRNIKEVAMAEQMYYRDNDEMRSGRQNVDGSICESWRQIVFPYLRKEEVFVDPENIASQYLDGFSDPGIRAFLCPSSSSDLGGLPALTRGFYWNNVYHSTMIMGDHFDNAGMSLSEVNSLKTTGDVVEGRNLFDDIGPFSQGWVDNVDANTAWLGADNPVTNLTGSNLGGKFGDRAQTVAYMDGHVRVTPYLETCAQFANTGADASNCASTLGCQSPAPVWRGDSDREGFWNFSEDDINAAVANTWPQFPNAVAQYCTSLPRRNR